MWTHDWGVKSFLPFARAITHCILLQVTGRICITILWVRLYPCAPDSRCFSLSAVPMGVCSGMTCNTKLVLDFLSCLAELEHFHCSSRGKCGFWDFSEAFILFHTLATDFLPHCLKCLCSQSKTWRSLLLLTKSFLLSDAQHSQSQLVLVSSGMCLRGIWVFVLHGRSTRPWEVSIS